MSELEASESPKELVDFLWKHFTNPKVESVPDVLTAWFGIESGKYGSNEEDLIGAKRMVVAYLARIDRIELKAFFLGILDHPDDKLRETAEAAVARLRRLWGD